MPMPESVPASLIIDTFKDVFRGERKGHRREARHERNIEQTCESINNSRLRNPPRWLTAWRMEAAHILQNGVRICVRLGEPKPLPPKFS